jgi:hypothetical protein
MQYLLYNVICFRVQGTIREVYVVDVMDVTLANCGVFTQWHAPNAGVGSTQYKRANGIPSPSGSDTDSP